MRKQLWFGSGGWTIDGLQVEWNKNADEEDETDGSKKGKKAKTETKPLKVFPGFSVNASYTSKTCSCCGNNISDLLRKLAEKAKADKKFRVQVGDEGKIQIEGKEIQLFGYDKSKPRKYYARRNERVPRTQPWAKGSMTVSELEKAVRENLRRPPLSKMSKDTTQSRFYCVFTECAMHNKEQHADVNAAINIGRRFFEKVHLTPQKAR